MLPYFQMGMVTTPITATQIVASNATMEIALGCLGSATITMTALMERMRVAVDVSLLLFEQVLYTLAKEANKIRRQFMRSATKR